MTNLYELSDEELANLDVAEVEPLNEEVNEETTEETNVDNQDATEIETPATEVDESMGGDSDTHVQDGGVMEEESSGDELEVDNTESETTETIENKEVDTGVNHQEFYNTLTKPFKANGREFQITNPNDMIALMQKGLNYSKKMEEMKPNLNLIKTLEQYGLTDESKLSYLIDLHNKKPEAIAKLIKDSEIDLYEFDTEQANHYVPQSKVVHKSQLEEVISEVVDANPDFNSVLNSIYTDWDNQSKQAVIDNPNILRIISEQQTNGIYDKIMNIMEYEKAVGRLHGISYLQAYSEIEHRLLGGSAEGQASQQPQQSQQQAQVFTAPRPNQTNNSSNTSEQKRKVASPSTNTAKPSTEVIDPLKMSDEELIAYMEKLNK
ncbi:hypothetical protein [Moraxella bovoculi]|uniref:hypothetical protein n=1 Tax=Moraxella bovoculi TaxID=386891 RepID=UPI00062480AC|nr:hypothetical protein [Moraxella bovoculi]AKG13506.1 hypothetical protein AAX11_05050 [Moraxella bovoculi]